MRIIGGRLPSIVFNGTTSSPSDTPVYSFGGVPFGAEAGNRLVVVYYSVLRGGTNNAPPHLVRIGGLDADQVQVSAPGGGTSGLWQKVVPSGTDGTVEVHRVADMIAGAISCWSIYDLRSTAVPVGDRVGIHAAVSPRTVTLNVPSKGVIIAGYFGAAASDWTGVNEDFEGTFSGIQFCGASLAGAVADSTYDITNTSGAGGTMMAACWR